MREPYAELDELVRGVERARKALNRTRGRQVRAAEHRQLLRATALGWFKGGRSLVAQSLPQAVLEEIDGPYRRILNAADKQSSKGTYLAALRAAKEHLLAGRSHLLISTVRTPTSEAAPAFGALVQDPAMRAILERRWNECLRCIDADAPLAATVMMGGLLEALLVARANMLSDKAKLFKAATVPIDPKTAKALDLRRWTLGPYIDVGHELGWISDTAKDVAIILRDYRNYVHPEKERSHNIALSHDDAVMFWEVTKTISRELLALKGQR